MVGSNKKGFSIFEILVVIMIIIIVGLISYPSLKSYQNNTELTSSTKSVISKLKLAQQYTVTEQDKYAIRVSLLTNQYQLVKKEPSEEIIETYYLEDDVIFESLTGLIDNEAVFNPTGAVDYQGDIFLIHQQTNKQTDIIIKPSGYVGWEYYES